MGGDTRADYRFLRRPRWLVGLVLALVAIIAFPNLGLWQLRRLEERRDTNTMVRERSGPPAVPLSVVLGGDQDPEALEFRLVDASGTYLPGEEVLLRSQSHLGQPGFHVLTPLSVADGVIVVDRGWVPLETSGPPVPDAVPPTGQVKVQGLLRASQTRGTFGPTDPEEGVLDKVSRVDLTRLAGQMSGPLIPVYLQLQSQDPQQVGLPVPAEPPRLGEGPHLGYAVQWFAFTGIVLIGFPVLVARTAREEGRRRTTMPTG